MLPIQEKNLQATSSNRTYLEEIAFIKANEKVGGVAATCFQTFVHWFLLAFCCFYPAYGRFYDAEVARVSQLPRTPLASPSPVNQILTSGRETLLESPSAEREASGLSANGNEPPFLSLSGEIPYPKVEILPRAIGEGRLISPRNAGNVATIPNAQNGQISPAIELQAVVPIAQAPAIQLPKIIKLYPDGELHDYTGIAGIEKDLTIVDEYSACHYVTLISPVTGAPVKVLKTGEPGNEENLFGYRFNCHKLCIRNNVSEPNIIQLQHYYEEKMLQELIVDTDKLYVVVGTEEKVYIPNKITTNYTDGTHGFSSFPAVSAKLRLYE